jgi:hypothetical protein
MELMEAAHPLFHLPAGGYRKLRLITNGINELTDRTSSTKNAFYRNVDPESTLVFERKQYCLEPLNQEGKYRKDFSIQK